MAPISAAKQVQRVETRFTFVRPNYQGQFRSGVLTIIWEPSVIRVPCPLAGAAPSSLTDAGEVGLRPIFFRQPRRTVFREVLSKSKYRRHLLRLCPAVLNLD